MRYGVAGGIAAVKAHPWFSVSDSMILCVRHVAHSKQAVLEPNCCAVQPLFMAHRPHMQQIAGVLYNISP
jgi:hypothetical protein